MNKFIFKILILLSIIIIVFGFFAGNKVKDELKSSREITENIYIDGSDATALTESLVEIGSTLLGVAMIIYSVVAVVCIWVIYGIIFLIILIIKKYKLQKNK